MHLERIEALFHRADLWYSFALANHSPLGSRMYPVPEKHEIKRNAARLRVDRLRFAVADGSDRVTVGSSLCPVTFLPSTSIL